MLRNIEIYIDSDNIYVDDISYNLIMDIVMQIRESKDGICQTCKRQYDNFDEYHEILVFHFDKIICHSAHCGAYRIDNYQNELIYEDSLYIYKDIKKWTFIWFVCNIMMIVCFIYSCYYNNLIYQMYNINIIDIFFLNLVISISIFKSIQLLLSSKLNFLDFLLCRSRVYNVLYADKTYNSVYNIVWHVFKMVTCIEFAELNLSSINACYISNNKKNGIIVPKFLSLYQFHKLGMPVFINYGANMFYIITKYEQWYLSGVAITTNIRKGKILTNDEYHMYTSLSEFDQPVQMYIDGSIVASEKD